MASPHLLHLGFLLLALVAPRPNMAGCSIDPAEGTQNSSSSSTNVTIYLCEDCESSRCKSRPISFNNFKKIAEIQNKIFSDRITELMTNETYITVCFEQRTDFPDGIYGIYWETDNGTGLSCDILNSGENGRGNIGTEKKKICCEAETDPWKRYPSLNCYTQKSGPKCTMPPADIPDEGIPGKPEFLTSKKNSLGILFAFLFVGVCAGWATMYYFLRLRRGQGYRPERWAPEGENLTHV